MFQIHAVKAVFWQDSCKLSFVAELAPTGRAWFGVFEDVRESSGCSSKQHETPRLSVRANELRSLLGAESENATDAMDEMGDQESVMKGQMNNAV